MQGTDPVKLACGLPDANSVFAEMLRAPGRKSIKPVVNKSLSTIDGWAKPLPSPDTPNADGKKNPLGSLDDILTHLGKHYPDECRLVLEWLARRHGYYLNPVIHAERDLDPLQIVAETADATSAFGGLLDKVSDTLIDDTVLESEARDCEAAFRRLVSEGQELVDLIHHHARPRRRPRK